MFSSSEKDSITKLAKKAGKNDEFEIMFNNFTNNNKMTTVNFQNIVRYFKQKSVDEKLKITNDISLDITYRHNDTDTYRISILGEDKINDSINLVFNRKNHVVFKMLLAKLDDKIKIIKKVKNKENIVDSLDYDIRFRMSQELKVTESEIKMLQHIDETTIDKIMFRLKHRGSITLHEKDIKVLFDVTSVKMNNNINKLNDGTRSNEVELDLEINKFDQKVFDKVMEEIVSIKKVIEQSKKLISNTEKKEVRETYYKLVNGNVNNENFYTMQPISTEIQHVVDKIPNKYTATDKADGTKATLIICNKKIYLIFSNFDVRCIGETEKFNNSILEGEYIYLKEQKKYLLMIFDCLFVKGQDARDVAILKKRLKACYSIVSEINKHSYKQQEYTDKFDLDKIKKFYEADMILYFDNMMKNLKQFDEDDVFIEVKYFLIPTGGHSCEIFTYSYLIWETFTKKSKCPYMLDGIILTGIEQKYTNNKKDWVHPMYKFKPSSHNSVDVYIVFKRNDNNNFTLTFDNSFGEELKGKKYRIAELYVGDKINNREVPVPFMEEEGNHEAYFPEIDGQIRDVEGNIVRDKSVIELVYTKNDEIPHKYRWSILRTRHDKTEFVEKFKRTYGNNKYVATNIWKSMTDSLEMSDLQQLSSIEEYEKYMKIMRSKVDTSIITKERKQDIYYQIKSELVLPMRKYHNFIKDILINTYCTAQPFEVNDKKKRLSVFDIGCGRGGDIMKIYRARVGRYVGIDIDYHGIYASATDGALSRWKKMSSKFPDFDWKKMEFINADIGTPLTVEEQTKVLAIKSEENEEKIKRILESNDKYDIVISQFVIHYLFADDKTLETTIKNIRKVLAKNGLIVFTLFDGDRINMLLDGKKSHTASYINDSNEKKTLFEIVKLYDDGDINKTGLPIDVHMAWISEEGKYEREYIVSYDFMVKTMREKCNARLVESDLFENMYELNKTFFTGGASGKGVYRHESKIQTKNMFENVTSFYGDLKGKDKESFNYSRLSRYYVFQAMD